MTEDFFPPTVAAKSIWLVTLADLALLLVGFFVLVLANQKLDQRALAQGLRAGFGAGSSHEPVPVSKSAPPIEPMAVGIAAMPGFARGSSVLPRSPETLIVWARDSIRDPRVVLHVIGSVDGSATDVEPITGSAAILAIDRARAVAAVLSSAVPQARMRVQSDLEPAAGGVRKVVVTISFAGDRQ